MDYLLLKKKKGKGEMKIKEKSGGEARGKAVQCVMGFLQRAPMSTLKPTKNHKMLAASRFIYLKKE